MPPRCRRMHCQGAGSVLPGQVAKKSIIDLLGGLKQQFSVVRLIHLDVRFIKFFWNEQQLSEGIRILKNHTRVIYVRIWLIIFLFSIVCNVCFNINEWVGLRKFGAFSGPRCLWRCKALYIHSTQIVRTVAIPDIFCLFFSGVLRIF